MDEVILTSHQRDELKELAERMQRQEPGLYVRRIGLVVLVDTRRLLPLQKERLSREPLEVWRRLKGGIVLLQRKQP